MPCSKTEWECKTEEDWVKEHEIAAGGSATAMYNFGELVDTHRQPPDAQSFRKLSTWNAGIDHLGVLLNIAARLV